MKQIWNERIAVGEVLQQWIDWREEFRQASVNVEVRCAAWWDKATGTTRIEVTCNRSAVAPVTTFATLWTREAAIRATLTELDAYLAGIDLAKLNDIRTEAEVREANNEDA